MTAVTSKPFGLTLWIAFEDKFTSLVNNDVRDWASLEAISNGKGAASREIRFALEPERQVSNTQMRDPGASNQLFINGEADVLVEKTVTGKQLDIVGEFDYDVYLRASHDISLIYTGPMAKTLSNMAINAKETFIKQYYGDGTGVIVSNTSSITINTTVSLTVGLNNSSSKYGCPYWVQEGMKLVPYTAAGQALDLQVSSGSIAYYKVLSVNHTATVMTMTVAVCASDGTVLAISGNSGSYPVATDAVWYNYADELNGGVAGNITAVADYGNLLYAPGLQAWGRDDGSTTYGVVHSGAYAGTNIDKGAGSLMFTDLGDMFAMGARRTGEGKYDYPTVKTSLKTWKYLIDLDEGSKELRPVNVEPSVNARGGKKYMYFYNDIASELVGRRFVPDFELWAEPKLLAPMDGATGEGPLQFKFTGFDFLSEPESNQHFRFKISSSGRHKVVQAHMTSFATFICSQSASLLRVKNFILS